jgi:predicted Rossmann fold flavoprotein
MGMMKMGSTQDVIVIGAGAAGLFFAGIAAARGKSVLLIDHRSKVAEKIRISGGGRCNFTNRYCGPDNFISRNPHFAKSALAGYSADDFIRLVEGYGIPFHEKKLGQLFCDNNAQDIIDMLLAECSRHGVETAFGMEVQRINKTGHGFEVISPDQTVEGRALVIATGGLSIPKIGATGFGYDIARQFGMKVVEPRAGLVPLTFTDSLKAFCAELSGLSVEASVACGNTRFSEGLLFTHRGLTGPSILQISSYWQEGQPIGINLMPHETVAPALTSAKASSPRQEVQTALSGHLPRKLAADLCALNRVAGRLADIPNASLEALGQAINNWVVKPAGTEGYRTAEVTLGGVDTSDLSSTDMQSKTCEGLYFIGEVVDVTGHLGGHNFQWAWSSAHAAASRV